MSQNNELPLIVRDTREKDGHGYNFRASAHCAGMTVEKLDFGDYAIKDNLDLIVIERKGSVLELIGNLGQYRERFERELQRMIDAGVRRKFIIVEDYLSAVFRRSRFTKMHPNSIFGSIVSLQIQYGIHFIFAGTKETAHRYTRSLLLKAWKHREELRSASTSS